MKFDIEKWNEKAEEESCNFMDYPESSIFKLFDEIERLETENECLEINLSQTKDRLDDYRQDYAKVVNEQCPHDEAHCGCVPILRRYQRITDDELANAKDELKIRRDELEERIKINIDVENHRFRYKTALELIASFSVAEDRATTKELIGIAKTQLGCDSERIYDTCQYWVDKLRDCENKLFDLQNRGGQI